MYLSPFLQPCNTRRVPCGRVQGNGTMIYKRAVAKLRAQEWSAIAIEIGIVVVGVFIGTWVANWNQDRIEQKEIGRLLQQLHTEVASFAERTTDVRRYYATTDRFAHVALDGWAGDPAPTTVSWLRWARRAASLRARTGAISTTYTSGSVRSCGRRVPGVRIS